MRKRGKVDLIQNETVKQLRQVGVSVQVLSAVGSGVPDLLCGFRDRNVLLELKTGAEPLTDTETRWHVKWGGQVAVVRSPEEAIEAVITEAMGV